MSKLNWDRLQTEKRITDQGSLRLGIRTAADYPRCPLCRNVLRNGSKRTLDSHLRRICSKYIPPEPQPTKPSRNPFVPLGAIPIREFVRRRNFPYCLKNKLVRINKKFGGRVIDVSLEFRRIAIKNPAGEVRMYSISKLLASVNK